MIPRGRTLSSVLILENLCFSVIFCLGLWAESESASVTKGIPKHVQEIYEFFEKEGLTKTGTWKDPERNGYARLIDSVDVEASGNDALKKYDLLHKEINDKENLHCLADDLLLLKGRMLLALKRHDEARQAFRSVISDYGTGKMDLFRGRIVYVSGLEDESDTLLLSTSYCVKRPNLSSDSAKLGMAQCAMAKKEYDKAKEILKELIPIEGQRHPSEDPVARHLEAKDYMSFFEAEDFHSVVSRRVDKIALLMIARCEVALGRLNEARITYEKLTDVFPCSSSRALWELEMLGSGQLDQIKETLRRDAELPELKLPFAIPRPKILEILKLATEEKRIEEVKAYLRKRFLSKS